jgi:hypothetical protein
MIDLPAARARAMASRTRRVVMQSTTSTTTSAVSQSVATPLSPLTRSTGARPRVLTDAFVCTECARTFADARALASHTDFHVAQRVSRELNAHNNNPTKPIKAAAMQSFFKPKVRK